MELISAPHNIHPLMKRPVRLEITWDIIFLVSAVEVSNFNNMELICYKDFLKFKATLFKSEISTSIVTSVTGHIGSK